MDVSVDELEFIQLLSGTFETFISSVFTAQVRAQTNAATESMAKLAISPV
jgi:hypothetical protein